MINRLSILILLLFPIISMGSDDFTKIQNLLEKSQNFGSADRISFISSYFIGKKATLGPLGEGDFDIFDKDPLFSIDDFDCTTFVETIIALSNSQDFDEFFENLIKIRYKNGEISFKYRNHFISLDWIPNNTSSGFLKDITSLVGPSQEAIAVIDKRSWYKKLNLSSIKGRNDLSETEKLALLETLRSVGEEFIPTSAKILNIKVNSIFENPKILNSIPNGTIISIVKPNWDLTGTIGTHLNVSHQGLAIWKEGSLYYRHASLEFEKVMDTPLLEYLERYKKSEIAVGINIQEILIN